MYLAVGESNFDLVGFLLQSGADANTPNVSGRTDYGCSLLWNAAYRGSVEIVESLLEHGARIPQSGAIQVAVERGFTDVLELPARFGADVNERLGLDYISHSSIEVLTSQFPLHFAVSKDQTAATK